MRAVASASRATRHSGCGPACAFARKCFRLIGGVFSREALAAEIDEQGQSSPLAIRSRTPEKGAELLRSLAGRPWNFQRRCVPASSRGSSFGPQTGGWNRIQLEVDDLAGEVETLRKTGARFRNEIVTGKGGRQILLDDPSGNPIELCQPA
jgi:hypothetical protein